jgi:putative sporulation protein YyaC
LGKLSVGLDSKGYFRSDDKFAAFKVARAVSETMAAVGMKYRNPEQERPIAVMCIGTDRSTGDSLGPLVGDMLVKWKLPGVHVFGTLDNPVHAKNLEEVMISVSCHLPCAFMVAIDASLGILEHVGCISVGHGPLKPGAGLKKELPPVGDMHITGIVNTGGFMDFLVLQSTRLSTVMRMADVIARGMHMAFNEFVTLPVRNDFSMTKLN